MQNLINALPKAKLWTLISACLLILSTLASLINVSANSLVIVIINLIFIVLLFCYRSSCTKLETQTSEEDLIKFCAWQRRIVSTYGFLLALSLLIAIIGIIAAIALPVLAG